MRPVLYTRFRPDWISIRRAVSGEHWEGQATVTIDEQNAKVLAIAGEELETLESSARTLRPFDDEKTVVSDIHVAEILLRHGFKKIAEANGNYPRSLWSRKPDLILHPIHLPDDGLNSFELVGLQALGCQRARTEPMSG